MGDWYYIELSLYINFKGIKVYDLIVFLFIFGLGSNCDNEYNVVRDEGILVVQCNFGLFIFSGVCGE